MFKKKTVQAPSFKETKVTTKGEFTAESPEVKAYLAEYPNVSAETAIEAVTAFYAVESAKK